MSMEKINELNNLMLRIADIFVFITTMHLRK